jgi:hypothetical protein
MYGFPEDVSVEKGGASAVVHAAALVTAPHMYVDDRIVQLRQTDLIIAWEIPL